MTYSIGVDGGGTKTECILVDRSGKVRGRHIAGSTNPSTVGTDAGRVLTEALHAVKQQASMGGAAPATTLLCMAGSVAYWTEFAETLDEFGQVLVFDDSLPVLELATAGKPGMVFHAGTGSFVAARDRDGVAHYAGGLGWRFGDQGSAYDLGCRAVTRALLERQGWADPTRLGALITERLGSTNYAELLRLIYGGANPNGVIAGLAPVVMSAFGERDPVATEIALVSAFQFLDFGIDIAGRLFGADAVSSLQVGVSGRILTNPALMPRLADRAPFRLISITEEPAEGVRRMLLRLAQWGPGRGSNPHDFAVKGF